MKSVTNSIWANLSNKIISKRVLVSFVHTYFKKISRPLCQISIVAYSIMLSDMHAYFFSYCRSTGCWHVRVYNTQQNTFYGTLFINITITQLSKPMTSQFDDRLIISNGKTMTSLKKFEFHKPNCCIMVRCSAVSVWRLKGLTYVKLVTCIDIIIIVLC